MHVIWYYYSVCPRTSDFCKCLRKHILNLFSLLYCGRKQEKNGRCAQHTSPFWNVLCSEMQVIHHNDYFSGHTDFFDLLFFLILLLNLDNVFLMFLSTFNKHSHFINELLSLCEPCYCGCCQVWVWEIFFFWFKVPASAFYLLASPPFHVTKLSQVLSKSYLRTYARHLTKKIISAPCTDEQISSSQKQMFVCILKIQPSALYQILGQPLDTVQ